MCVDACINSRSTAPRPIFDIGCIATKERPPHSICFMRVRRGSKTQAGRLRSLVGALGPGGDALEAGARDPPQTNVRIKVSAGGSGGTKPNCFFTVCDPQNTSIPLQRGAHSL